MNLDEEIKKASDEMERDEDALVAAGFSEEHWMLIKSYVWSAIIQTRHQMAKDWQEKISAKTYLANQSVTCSDFRSLQGR
jgi:hypothetical protein